VAVGMLPERRRDKFFLNRFVGLLSGFIIGIGIGIWIAVSSIPHDDRNIFGHWIIALMVFFIFLGSSLVGMAIWAAIRHWKDEKRTSHDKAAT